jgi:hypothetical protein
MSLLTIVQSAAPRIGVATPTAVATSTDLQVIQLLALLNEEGAELGARWEWQSLLSETTFTTLATESQGAISTIAPNMKYILNDTIWNRTLRRPLFGPMTPQRWQQLKAMSMQGPWNQWRIRGGNLLMTPVPAAGQTCYFEYVSKAWALSVALADKVAFTADDDTSKLDEDIMALGLIWRFKAAKGFSYAEDFNKYERRVVDAMAQDGTKDTLNMGDSRYDIYPGITIPSGSWGT